MRLGTLIKREICVAVRPSRASRLACSCKPLEYFLVDFAILLRLLSLLEVREHLVGQGSVDCLENLGVGFGCRPRQRCRFPDLRSYRLVLDELDVRDVIAAEVVLDFWDYRCTART
jgi:hypothetical protein